MTIDILFASIFALAGLFASVSILNYTVTLTRIDSRSDLDAHRISSAAIGLFMAAGAALAAIMITRTLPYSALAIIGMCTLVATTLQCHSNRAQRLGFERNFW